VPQRFSSAPLPPVLASPARQSPFASVASQQQQQDWDEELEDEQEKDEHVYSCMITLVENMRQRMQASRWEPATNFFKSQAANGALTLIDVARPGVMLIAPPDLGDFIIVDTEPGSIADLPPPYGNKYASHEMIYANNVLRDVLINSNNLVHPDDAMACANRMYEVDTPPLEAIHGVFPRMHAYIFGTRLPDGQDLRGILFSDQALGQ